jgi:O-antigen/teichoic acid export membrane protein
MAVNQLKAGAVLNYVSLALSGLVGIAYTPFMLRMLGQSEYGLYSLAASIISYLSILDFGFGNAVIRYTAKFRAEGKTEEQYSMFGMFTVLYSVIGVITIIAGMVLYWNIDNMFGATFTAAELSRTRVIILLMIFNLAFTFPLSIYGAIITAYEDFIFLRVVQIARTILNMAVMICLLLLGYKAIAMVVVQTVFNFVTLGLNVFYCKNKIHIRIKFAHVNWGFLKEVSIYSFWIFLNVIMDRIYWSTGQFVLGIFAGAAAVAVYAVAIQLYNIYMIFSNAVSGVFLPRITSMVVNGNSYTAISDLFVRTGRIQYIVMSYILSCFIIFGKSFIMLWAGANYEDTYLIALLLFIPGTVPLIQNLGIIILQARNQMKFRSVLYVLVSIVCLGLSILLAKRYGGVGCAFGTAISVVIGQIIIINIYYWKRQHIDILKFWKEILKMSIVPVIIDITAAAIIFTAKIDLLNIRYFIIASIVFSVVFVFMFWRFSMNVDERQLISKPVLNVIYRFRR